MKAPETIDWTAIVQVIPLSTIITDGESTIIETNKAAIAMFGFERAEQILGRKLEELAGFKNSHQGIKSDADGIVNRIQEIELKQPDGTLISILAYVSKTNTPYNPEHELIWFLVDISLYKRTNEMLQARFLESDNANKSKSFYLAHISHGIRSQLNSIIGLCQLLREKSSEAGFSQEIIQYLKTIEFSSEQLQAFVTSILELSAVEQGHLTVVQSTDCQLEPLIQSVYEFFKDIAAKKSLWFTFEIGTAVPLVINTDKHLLIQILTNLVDNAIKFTGSGNAVKLSVQADERFIVFAIEDEGRGMTDVELVQVADLFAQSNLNGLEGPEGTGLGLAMAKKLADLLGAKLTVETSRNRGSSFHLKLPIHATTQTGSTIVPKLVQPTGFSSENRLLIIEDDAMNREVYQAWFEEFKFKVYYADNGPSGLKAAKEFSPNLIITDIHLPGMDGIAVIRELRQSGANKDTPILVISASTFTDKKEQAYRAGCNEYLAKPLDFHGFLNILKRYLKTNVHPKGPEHYFAGIEQISETQLTELNQRLQTLSELSIIRLERLISEITAIKKIFNDHGHTNFHFLDLIEASAFDGNEKKLHSLVEQAITFYTHQLGNALES